MNEKLNNLGSIMKDTFKILKTKGMLKIVFLSLIASIMSALIDVYRDIGNVLNLPMLFLAIGILDIFLMNGAFNAFKIYLEENRIVDTKEFFNITKQNVWNYIIITYAAPFAAVFVATALNFILVNLELYDMMYISIVVTAVVGQWLLFNGYIAMAGKNSKKIKNNKYNWIVFAIIKCLIYVFAHISILHSLESIIFMLFTLVHTYREYDVFKESIDI